MGLLGKVKRAVTHPPSPSRVVRGATQVVTKTARSVGAYGQANIAELQRRPLVGIARIAVSTTGVGALGLLAYDAKRLHDKAGRAKDRYRDITKQALRDAQTIQERLATYAKPHARSVGPLADVYRNSVVRQNPADQGGGGVAQPAPDVESEPAPATDIETTTAPSPDERGAGGDAAEGTRTVFASLGGGLLPGLLIVGLLAASWASRRAQ